MKKVVLVFSFSILFFSCSNKSFHNFESVETTVLLEDSISIRAILLKNNELWFSGNNGKYGTIDLITEKRFNGQIVYDSLFPEFRSIAQTKDATFVMCVGNPALLYRISNDKKRTTLVYSEYNENVFYDSMQFLDDSFGIAMGDPVSNCMNVIVTNDGGLTWSKILCDKLPKVIEGEAAFAASNTNLVLRGNSIFMVSGGKKSRCFVSTNKGKSWDVYNTPIVQGESMTGIFTSDFYNEKIGFIAGGDYENQKVNLNNKAITKDGGKTWKLVGQHKGFGYASCIQFLPNSKGKSIVSVGSTGVYLSNSSGNDWKEVSKISDLYTIRFLNDSVAYAAGKNKIVRFSFK